MECLSTNHIILLSFSAAVFLAVLIAYPLALALYIREKLTTRHKFRHERYVDMVEL